MNILSDISGRCPWGLIDLEEEWEVLFFCFLFFFVFLFFCFLFFVFFLFFLFYFLTLPSEPRRGVEKRAKGSKGRPHNNNKTCHPFT